MNKADTFEIYAFIVKFEAEFKTTPGTAMLAQQLKLNPQTIRKVLRELDELGKIEYKQKGGYNTSYKLK